MRHTFRLGIVVLLTSFSAQAEHWICNVPCAPGKPNSTAHGTSLENAWKRFNNKCMRNHAMRPSEALKKSCQVELTDSEDSEETTRPTKPTTQSTS